MDDNPSIGASVFTTLRWSSGRVAWLNEHLKRLQEHATRHGIEWPIDFPERLSLAIPSGSGNLCRIQLNRDGSVETTLRETNYSNSPLIALSHTAPRFPKMVQGTKHAAWEGYQNARSSAITGGADLALLVHDGAVVDGDRCTPILLDKDGVAYAPSMEGGGINSITLDVLKPAIEAAGIPFHYARLTEKMLGRASEVIVVGTGVGVAWLNEIEGQQIGTNSPGPLYKTCNTAFELALDAAWSDLG
ncbi:MAG: aminotransferase class IV [Candidatus Thermoplasmatota archaeon]|nr:aminotransferase class IV [Candidatus Thermoplasmatota archaeon]